MSQEDWELAELTDEDGGLGRPVPSGKIFIPGRVELKGDSIEWGVASSALVPDSGPARTREVSRVLLNQFVGLWNKSPREILRFAKEWGVLVLKGDKEVRPCGEGVSCGREPLAAWRYYSRRACAVLNIAAALRKDPPQLGSLDDWNEIAVDRKKPEALHLGMGRHAYTPFGMGFGSMPEARPQYSLTAIDGAREAIASEVQLWMTFWKDDRLHGVSDFRIDWDGRRWNLKVDYHGFLFAAIALQLALVLADADSLYSCSGCGRPYIRDKKRPKPGCDNYCENCKGISKRKAVETYREKKARACQLRSDGMSPEEIATELNTTSAKVKAWIKKGKQNAKAKTR